MMKRDYKLTRTPSQMADYLDSIALHPPDLTEEMEQCGQVILEGIAETYQQETDPCGDSWAALLPLTWLKKTTTRMLVESGKLEGHATGDILEVTGDSVTAGVRASDVPYAKFHQFGTTRMPARPFHGMSEETVRKCDLIVANKFARTIAG